MKLGVLQAVASGRRRVSRAPNLDEWLGFGALLVVLGLWMAASLPGSARDNHAIALARRTLFEAGITPTELKLRFGLCGRGSRAVAWRAADARGYVCVGGLHGRIHVTHRGR